MQIKSEKSLQHLKPASRPTEVLSFHKHRVKCSKSD